MRKELREITLCLLSACLIQGATAANVPSIASGASSAKAQVETPESLFDLGLAIALGTDGQAKNPDKGVSLIEQSASRGYAPAQYYMGLHCMEADKNSDALKYLRKAANQGHAGALYQMGNAYLNGTGVSKDTEMAIEYFRRGAEAGDPDSQSQLAVCYRDGIGVPVDINQTRRWLQKATNSGDTWAKANLGVMLIKGEGGPANRAKGERLMIESASEGMPDALEVLADFYLEGEFFEKDVKKAELLLQAGISRGSTSAMCSYARMLIAGTEVKKDYSKAKELLLEAVKLGNGFANYLLGVMYENGFGCDANLHEAASCYNKAHELGVPAGTTRLVYLHLQSEAYEISDYVIEPMLLSSAKQGDSLAQMLLGILYQDGYKAAIPENIEKAKYWFTQAYNNGREEAADYLPQLKGVELERAGENLYALSSARQQYEDSPTLGNFDACFAICRRVTEKLEVEISKTEKTGIVEASDVRKKQIENILALFNGLRDSLVPLEKGLDKVLVNGDLSLDEGRPRRDNLQRLVSTLKNWHTEFISEWILAPDLAMARNNIELGLKPWYRKNDRRPIKTGMYYLTKACDKDFLFQANDQIQGEFGEVYSLLKDSVQPEEFEDYKTLSTLWGRVLSPSGQRGGNAWWEGK